MGDLKQIFAILAVLVTAKESSAQNYRVCADSSHTNPCQAIEKDGGRVSCTLVSDHIDCALKIAYGTADFGMFSSEEVVYLAAMQPDIHPVIASIKHENRKSEQYAFQTVAVVKSNHQGGLEGLRNTGFCHPGYGASDQSWSERVLKYFEKKVANAGTNCVQGATPAQDEVTSLTGFFKDACRPGPWSPDTLEDAKLKSENPQLCQLCSINSSDRSCQYNYTESAAQVVGATVARANSHVQALQCLSSGLGAVSYVAWEHAKEFLQNRVDPENYGLLCENGTVVSFNSTSEYGSLAPCAWVRQPWAGVLARRDVSASLLSDLRTWMPNGRSTNTGTWTDVLDGIMFSEPSSVLDYPAAAREIIEYVNEARLIPAWGGATSSCQTVVRWCTTSTPETFKCTWVRQAAISLGLEPVFSCVQSNSDLGCMDSILQDRSDFTSIDSNYGFLARQHFGLGPVLYHQTRQQESSRVVALLKESSTQEISRFENLRDKKACFPEYGGIAFLSFLRAAHERGVISEGECEYARAVGDFFGSSCAPGATDDMHQLQGSVDVEKLCSLCRAPGASSGNTSINEQGVATLNTTELVCGANYTNEFYGTNGTMACMSDPNTDVAFIEQQNLNNTITNLNLNASHFRVLCRNNTLAGSTGINVDDGCALSVTVDGEIVARSNWTQKASLIALLKSMDDLFGYTASPNQIINLKIFSPWSDYKDLLFKDSTIGLTTSDTSNDQVVNYVNLFKHLEACTNSATSIGRGLMLATLAFIWHMFRMATR